MKYPPIILYFHSIFKYNLASKWNNIFKKTMNRNSNVVITKISAKGKTLL